MSLAQKILNLSRSLLPTGRAFKMPFSGTFEKMMKGIQASEIRAWNDMLSTFDSVFPDNENFTTQDAADWERRLGIITNEETDLEDRKLAIKRKINHPGTILGRQHYLYLQNQLQAAGFDVYVHDNRFGTPLKAISPDEIRFFVSVSPDGTTTDQIINSADGISWTERTIDSSNQWYDVTFGDNIFVSVAIDGHPNQVMTSSDGNTWTLRTTPVDLQWRSVTYGDGLFVAVASNGAASDKVMTSPDGITWTTRTAATNNAWRSVTYGDGLFVAVSNTGTGNRVMTSPDGITWTSRTSAADNDWRSITYGNGLFVAVSITGTGNRVMTSPDGITWTSRTSAADNLWLGVTYGGGLFVAVASDGAGNQVMTSPDGITWTLRTTPLNTGIATPSQQYYEWVSIAYSNNLFVAVSNIRVTSPVMTSPDGITWTIRTVPTKDWQSVTAIPGQSGYSVIANYIKESLDQDYDYGITNFKSTFIVGGSIFGTYADVSISRKEEFRQLILRVKPVQTAGFLLIDYV